MAVKPTLLGDFGITVTMVRKQQWMIWKYMQLILLNIDLSLAPRDPYWSNIYLCSSKISLCSILLRHTQVSSLHFLALFIYSFSALPFFSSWAPLYILFIIPGRPNQLVKTIPKLACPTNLTKHILKSAWTKKTFTGRRCSVNTEQKLPSCVNW